MLNVIDEFTRECLCIRVGRKLGSADVIDVLTDLFIARGTPGFIRSDNGPEFVAVAVRGWISGIGAKLLDMEVFNTLLEARVLIEQWRTHCNTIRPHSSLGYRPPAPEVLLSGMPMPPGRSGPTGSPPPPATMLH